MFTRGYTSNIGQSSIAGSLFKQFEKDDKVYPEELEMLKALLQNIKDSGIKPNN